MTDTQRLCAECSAPISQTPNVLFCTRYCAIQYLHDHEDVPKEPVEVAQ